jgi:hypothetical protein
MDHHATFALVYGPGLVLAVGMAALAPRLAWTWVRPLCLLASVGVLWFALLLATHLRYGAWQSMPDPPDEAFADGARLVATLVAGWVPALPICGVAYLVSWWLARRASRRAQPA